MLRLRTSQQLMNVKNEANTMVDAKLLELLVCPVTKGRLEYDRKNNCLVSKQAKLVFPIVGRVPNMQLGTALPLESLDDEENKSDDK